MQQTTTSIKDKLHQAIQAIECIGDKKVLEAVYTISASYKNEAEDYELTDEQVKELEKRRADHLAGKTKSYSLEEFKKEMNEKYGY